MRAARDGGRVRREGGERGERGLVGWEGKRVAQRRGRTVRRGRQEEKTLKARAGE